MSPTATSEPPGVPAGADRDPIGHRVHCGIACLHLVTIPLSTALTSITFAILLVYAGLRLWATWRDTRPLLGQSVLVASMAWIGVQTLGFAWSQHPGQALDELSASRMLLLPILLWPVLDRAPMLVAALLTGVAATNVIQIGQALEILGLSPEEGRLTGLMHPIITGACCVAAMCWHLAAFADGRRITRILAIAGLGLAAFGLLTSGSRGPWVAAAVSVPLVLLVLLMKSDGRRWIVTLIGVGLVGLAIAWPLARSSVVPRLEQAISEWNDAETDGVVWTSAGLRRALWRWSMELFASQPLIGVGPGDIEPDTEALPSFKAAAARATEATYRATIPEYDDLIRDGVDPATHRLGPRAQRRSDRLIASMSRAHTHSIPLNTLARLGILGAVVLTLFMWTVIRQAVRSSIDHLYARATLFVLIGWLVGGLFDCYDLNAHTMGLLGLVITLTLPNRPAVK